MEKMGGLIGRLTRPLKNFNVENRAQKVISKDKPVPAPRHPTTLKYMKEMKEGVSKPTVEEQKVHLDRLKQVYVTSTEPEVTRNPATSETEERQLPLDRQMHEDPEFGYLEPERIHPGKATLRQVVDLINKHGVEPERWTASELAQEYKLDVQLTQDILNHFRPFTLRVPEKTKLDKDWKKSWAKQLPMSSNTKLVTDKSD